MLDLLIKGGRVADWKNHTDRILNLGVQDGRIAYLGTDVPEAARTIDAVGLIVIPGVIDSHMHASSWLGGSSAFRMMAKAGVTTAMEMAGPLETVFEGMKREGAGLTIAVLQQLKPGLNISGTDPSDDELKRAIQESLESGAYGVKLLGGHYPMTPDAMKRLIRICCDSYTFLAIHAGSTEYGSNLEGVREVIVAAEGRPFHLAHINAYCRGNVEPLEDEIRETADLLSRHPEIETESYLSPINGCSAKCRDDVPESGVTRSCLKSHGYDVSAEGILKAVADGYAAVHEVVDGFVTLASPEKGIEILKARGMDVPVSFKVNPALSRFYFATQKKQDGTFLVNSFCTDGGGIPRNVILKNGLLLVDFGALTLQEFVLKSSYETACRLGLTSKGHFSAGADADITIADPVSREAVSTFISGQPVLEEGKVVARGGTIVTTPDGADAVRRFGLPSRVVDVRTLLKTRWNR